MGLLKKIGSLFGSPSKSDDAGYWIAVQCNRCGEIVRVRIDMRNDLSINYEEGGGYFCHKTLIGDQLCFQRMEVELTFDRSRNLVNRKVQGGKFVEAET
jgi:hypothetical protein